MFNSSDASVYFFMRIENLHAYATKALIASGQAGMMRHLTRARTKYQCMEVMGGQRGYVDNLCPIKMSHGVTERSTVYLRWL